jgi:ankyrin repeat protein
MANPGRPRKCDPKVEDLRYNIRQEDFNTAKNTLKEFGIDAGDGDGRSALINAVIENKPDFIRWLIDNKANVNHQDRNGYTALHFAGQNLLVDIAKLLLDHGANPNLQDKHGNPPLWTAIFESRTKDLTIVKTLLKYKADPDIVNNYGKTPGNMYDDHYGTSISLLT